ncbi:HD domain-containing phosphohydrolase [Bacillus sp. FJAT-45350]|uniref:HD domain-containing phosphohydrolase n=1 Tax=Bacillus sp. FJAT-45350 TaxID=2011014 RepID=UPI000BB78735|nr:HD domain-containing phosphohydrolase [Bacillus sp. FJAT-45350]
MTTYRSFIKTLARHYVIGSLISGMGVGSVILFTTLEMSSRDLFIIAQVIAVSIIIMLISEFLLFKQQIKPIMKALTSDQPTIKELKLAYLQTHRFPMLTGIRILGPHLWGMALPATFITAILIIYDILYLPFEFILYGLIGAILISGIHAMIEYFQTTFVIGPVLETLRKKAKTLYQEELSIEGIVLVSIKTKFQLSALLIGALPLLLFSLATQIRLSSNTTVSIDDYWTWSGIILLLGICLSLYGAWLLFSIVMKPIQHLRAKMKDVEEGKFDTKATDLYSDEFSELISGFNHMVRGLKERETMNAQMHESFFTTMSAALDARDHYTAGHSIRVANYSVEIGRRAKLTQTELMLLRKTALLHDIGKIGIPDSVLLKDGKLTEQEFAEIKRHPVLGEEILKQIQPSELMEPFMAGVRSHHERIDGKGYPDKLSGDDIPLIGRLIAVADAFDAMTSDRPYRKGMSPIRALQILKDGKGTQWEAQFVDYFEEWLIEQDYHIEKVPNLTLIKKNA